MGAASLESFPPRQIEHDARSTLGLSAPGGVIRLGWADAPRDASLAQIYGVAVLCGIGFTMSLFIGNLAFADPLLIEETKIGVLLGSMVSAVLGVVILRYCRPCSVASSEAEDV